MDEYNYTNTKIQMDSQGVGQEPEKYHQITDRQTRVPNNRVLLEIHILTFSPPKEKLSHNFKHNFKVLEIHDVHSMQRTANHDSQVLSCK